MRSFLFTLLFVLIAGLPALAQVAPASDNDHSGPLFDVGVGFQRLEANAPPASCQCFGDNGGFANATYWISHRLGVVGEFTGGNQNNISSLGQNLTLMTFMGGPHVKLPFGRLSVFGEFLLGEAYGSNSYFPTTRSYSTSASSFAYSPGGGVDFRLTRRFSIRAAQARYLHTTFPNGTSNEQNQLMIGAGLLVHLGHLGPSTRAERPSPPQAPEAAVVQPAPPPPPPPPPPAPTVIDLSCTSAMTEVQAGATLEVAAIAQTSPTGAGITFAWASSGGQVLGSGGRVTVDTTSLPPGEYHVTSHAQVGDDASSGRSCDVVFRVVAPPPPPPAPEKDVTPEDFRDNVHDVLFDLNKWDLRPDTLETLQQNAAFLNAHPKIRILIGGFTDERGSTKSNLVLGGHRVQAVRDHLVTLGVDPDRIQIVTFGRNTQVCTDSTEKCWQQNRRVGFVMQP